jgi:tryptophanyl-tRNA synthetase
MKNYPNRVLTGMRTTGSLHLGHYVGALKMWLQAQEEDLDCYFLLADVQALTTHADNPKLISDSVREVVLDWLAVGLDPFRSNVHFVLQSGVQARFEISQYLLMIANLGEIERNPTIKDEMRGNRNPSMGFLTYPVDQAADVYMVSPIPGQGRLLVPVGEDQVPHLEYSRVLARRFNKMYKADIFTPCEAKVGEVGRLVGIDGQEKMSKSKGNSINLSDTPDEVRKKVMKMYTDPGRKKPTDPGNVEGNPLFIYFDAFATDKTEIEHYKDLYRAGEVGDVVLKMRLIEILNDMLGPMQDRRAKYEHYDLMKLVSAGTLAASDIAEEVLSRMKSAMYLW